jgi:hypothetical protein
MAATENRYIVELLDILTNDLGQMTETQLFGYLSTRPLLDCTPEQVLAALGEKDEVTVHLKTTLGSAKVTDVKIRRVRSISSIRADE